MRVVVDKGMLQRRLRVIERIVPRRGGLPFHYAVYMDVDVAGAVQLWAANAKEAFVTTMPSAAEDWEDGATAIPSHELIRAVNAAPGETVELSVEVGDGGARVESGTARWNIEPLAGVSAQDWGLGIEVVDSGEINRSELVRVLQACRYAASKTESRPSFQQVHVGEGRTVAADGRRIHQEALGPVGDVPTFDVPERAVDTLVEALSVEEESGQVFVSTGPEGEMSFRFGTSEYVVGRLNYQFPDVDPLVLERARTQGGTVVLNRDDFVTAAKVAVVAIDENGTVELNFTNGVIEVRGTSQRSEGRMEVRCSNPDVLTGTRLTVNANDLLDLLGRVPVEEDDDLVFTISNDQGSDPGWLYVSAGSTEAAIRPVIT